MTGTNPRPHHMSRGTLLKGAAVAGAGVALVPSSTLARMVNKSAAAAAAEPIKVTVFAPGDGDISGVNGADVIVDLALDAAPGHNNELLGQPRFIAPTDPAFGPGPNPAVPGLVVLFSTTKAFAGPRTNLANLFQLTGIATVNGNQKEVWTTWLVGKPIAGVDVDTVLTTFVVSGTAPTVVPTDLSTLTILSNVITVKFHIAGPGIPLSATPYYPPHHHHHHHRPHHRHHR
ncbi:MAG: hypothetical protein NVS2B16_30590 [Chloroflexota bacterium]